jgi:diguanylate cyclase (GGDEF)-like protein
VGTPLDSKIAKILIEEQKEYFGDADILGTHYRTFYMPLFDGKNEVFAAVFLGTRMELLKAASNALVRNVFIISFIGLFVSIAILYGVISSISRPLIALTRDMDRIEEGSLGVIVEAYSGDEIGHAGKALQKVVDTIHKLIDDINTTISEHEKGNTEYHLDTEAFRGAYRLLADRIIELSSLGMRDQLTGLPNRRSFDRRLDSEWKRAIREKIPLSVLMMDVDKFKTYNDTYGHQQGDVVLQVVAKTLPIPIRRVIDFAARWGGEEFVVLLPHTDSTGAVHVAEMIRSGVEHAEIPSIDGGQAKKVTISIGVSTQIPTPEGTIAELISQADAALYQAKETGRNRVCRNENVQ